MTVSIFGAVNKWHSLLQFLRFYFGAKTLHGIHSPFLYSLLEEVLDDQRHYYRFDEIEALREKLLELENPVQLTDYGAGSRQPGAVKSIGTITRNAASRSVQCQMLFRMIRHLQPKSLLEMGTSVGISTAYLASANANAQITALEGDPALVEIARKTLDILDIKNATILPGEFGTTLPFYLATMDSIDFAFIDGNHRFEPTLEYYQMIKEKTGPDSIIVLDDIHWSREMDEAWKMVRQDPDITIALDFFAFGVIFFKKEILDRLDLRIIGSRLKPLQIFR